MNNLKIYPLCSRPFQQTIGLAFNVEEIQPEYRARRRLEVPVHESRGRARSRRQDQNKTRGARSARSVRYSLPQGHRAK